MARIDDGTGQGFVAAVASTNRLLVNAESVPAIAIASATRADAYTITTDIGGGGTGLVTGLVAGTQSGLLYVQNTSGFPLSIGGFFASTTNAGVFRLYKDVTGGTLVSAGTVAVPQQLNVASGKVFAGSARRANASGQTVTGGTVVALGYVVAGFQELQLAGALLLGTNDAIALTFTPIGANADAAATVVCAYLAG